MVLLTMLMLVEDHTRINAQVEWLLPWLPWLPCLALHSPAQPCPFEACLVLS